MGNIFQSLIDTTLGFDRYVWINILTTVLFFYIIQTLFFMYAASNQYNDLLLHKAKFFSQLGKYNEGTRLLIENMKADAEETLKENALKAKKDRIKINKNLIFNYCVKPIIFVTILLVGLIIYCIFTKAHKRWNYIETISLVLIFGSYLTELYFFFFIIQKYEIVSDDKLIYKLFKRVNDVIGDKISIIEKNQSILDLHIKSDEYTL